MGRPRTLLILCHGNLCRSPYLQAVIKRALPEMRVESAGFMALGGPAPPFAVAVSARRGIDLSGFRSRPLVQAMVRGADLIVVMDDDQADRVHHYYGVPRHHIIVAGDLDPLPSSTRAILDPYDQPMAAFEASYNRLDRCAETLVTLLRH